MAEYEALVNGLRIAVELGVRRLDAHGDSQLRMSWLKYPRDGRRFPRTSSLGTYINHPSNSTTRLNPR
jgi:ribonuclease HI